MKRFIFTLTLAFACLLAAPTKVIAQTVIVGYQPAVDYYGNYYWKPVYGSAQNYRRPTTNRKRYYTPTQKRKTTTVRNPAALYGMEQARRKQEEIRAQIRKAERERSARWAKSFSTGG